MPPRRYGAVVHARAEVGDAEPPRPHQPRYGRRRCFRKRDSQSDVLARMVAGTICRRTARWPPPPGRARHAAAPSANGPPQIVLLCNLCSDEPFLKRGALLNKRSGCIACIDGLLQQQRREERHRLHRRTAPTTASGGATASKALGGPCRGSRQAPFRRPARRFWTVGWTSNHNKNMPTSGSRPSATHPNDELEGRPALQSEVAVPHNSRDSVKVSSSGPDRCSSACRHGGDADGGATVAQRRYKPPCPASQNEKPHSRCHNKEGCYHFSASSATR